MAKITLYILPLLLFFSCVDPEEVNLRGTVDVVVVDGTITNLNEPQYIKLNWSKADPVTGRFGTEPLTKAIVEVVEDSATVMATREVWPGTYQVAGKFRGQIGHAYQLRFTLADGTKYQSTQQVLPDVPPIRSVKAQFNPNSLSANLLDGYTAAHDFFLESQDPAGEHNYYRWEWKLYEHQYWCKSCVNGVYSIYKIVPGVYYLFDYFVTGKEIYEECFTPPAGKASWDAPTVPGWHWYYDYQCRSDCWEILYSYDIDILDDVYTNGGLITQKKVAQIPFYTTHPCLVDIRQLSLTADAYRYYKLFEQQTQNTGGLADTPPTLLGGNVHQVNNPNRRVIGYFTASAVSQVHYWLDRKDAQGIALGDTDPNAKHSSEGDDLYFALYRRTATPEPPPPYVGAREVPKIRLWPNTDRPPTAPCLLSDHRTPFKPEGWRE